MSDNPCAVHDARLTQIDPKRILKHQLTFGNLSHRVFDADRSEEDTETRQGAYNIIVWPGLTQIDPKRILKQTLKDYNATAVAGFDADRSEEDTETDPTCSGAMDVSRLTQIDPKRILKL